LEKEDKNKTKELKLRLPIGTDKVLVGAVDTLKGHGYDVTKTSLVKTLLEYRLSNAVYIFKEVKKWG
jgi:hypothetical protein